MSTISIPRIGKQSVEDITKKKVKEKALYSSSHEYHIIIGIACLIFSVVFVLGIAGPLIYSYYDGLTGLGMDVSSECIQKIHSFQQRGFYASQEQFRSALSYCSGT
jgi:hypothetical protein